MTVRIGIIEPSHENACSYYRSLGPLAKLKNIEIYLIDKIQWPKMNILDILFVGRPDHKNFLDIMEIAKDMQIPTWVDWDDNVLELPEYNPAFNHFNERRGVIIECLKVADVITVSTETLKNQFLQFNQNIHIIENALNDYNYSLKKQIGQKEAVIWRGGNSHRGDLMSVSEAMISVSKVFPDIPFIFLGGDPWYIADNITNSAKAATIDMISYHRFLLKNPYAVMQVPLEDNNFNRSKSNIAWIEGTISGCAVIAQNLPEFQKPGITTYDTPDKYKYYLEKLLNSKEYRLKNYNESFDYINSNLLLTEKNKLRQNIIEGLL